MKQSHLLRLNKAIAACGFCSRRNADSFIADGQVKVNGKIVKDFHLLVNLDKDAIDVAGKKLSAQQKEYVILHKPRAFISTCQDEFERKRIIDLLPKNLKHLKPAGRLDYDSTGLILLTNDGLLINSLIHPKNEIEKTYKIIVAGKMTAQALKELSSGIHLKEAKTKSAKVRLIKCSDQESTIEITIKEGKNRQLRRMCAQLGLPVLHLVRTAVSKLQLGSLPAGKWRYLTKDELANLRKDLKLPSV